MNTFLAEMVIILIHDLATFFANFLVLANVFLGVVMPGSYAGEFLRSSVGYRFWQVWLHLGFLLRTPWPAKPDKKLLNFMSMMYKLTFLTTKNDVS